MTDIIPNDLSHMSDEDFNALCPQGHHAPGAEPLSPAANAVLDAAKDAYWSTEEMCPNDAEVIAAAALRAAAERIEDLYCESSVEDSDGVVFAMRQLMFIAAELEDNANHND